MWIMHPKFGFLSIVEKPESAPGLLTIRARSREHLEAFLDGLDPKKVSVPPIRENAGTDYAFRCVLHRKTVGKLIGHYVADIDYANFKDECKRQGQPKSWLRRLANIWNQHFQYQRQNAT